MIFHWSLSDSKSPQVSRTRLSILADNAVALMVSTCPLISKSSIFVTMLLKIVPSTLTAIGITVTFMFLSFSTFLSFYFRLLLLCGPPEWLSPLFGRFSFIVIVVVDYHGLVVWPRFGNLFVSQNPREVCASFSRTDSVCAYTICSF